MGKATKPSPVETYKLYRAEWILESRGLHDFLDYCDAEDFTANDVEAVQNKVNKVFKLSDLKKILTKTTKEVDEVPF